MRAERAVLDTNILISAVLTRGKPFQVLHRVLDNGILIFSDPTGLPTALDLSSYVEGWTALRVSFTTFYLNSFLIAALAVVGNLMACSLTAYAFARLQFRFRRIWFALMLGTLMLPYHVTLVPQYVLFLNFGWVNTFLPLIVPKFLAVDAFFIFLMVQFFRGIPREIDEAAIMDGCGPWRIFWRIMLPLSTPVMATAAIFSFIWTYDDFLGPLIYLNDMRQYTVPLALRFRNGSQMWAADLTMFIGGSATEAAAVISANVETARPIGSLRGYFSSA